MKLSFLAKPSPNKLEDALLGHLGSDVEVVRVRKASELLDIQLLEVVLNVQLMPIEPASEQAPKAGLEVSDLVLGERSCLRLGRLTLGSSRLLGLAGLQHRQHAIHLGVERTKLCKQLFVRHFGFSSRNAVISAQSAWNWERKSAGMPS